MRIYAHGSEVRVHLYLPRERAGKIHIAHVALHEHSGAHRAGVGEGSHVHSEFRRVELAALQDEIAYIALDGQTLAAYAFQRCVAYIHFDGERFQMDVFQRQIADAGADVQGR